MLVERSAAWSRVDRDRCKPDSCSVPVWDNSLLGTAVAICRDLVQLNGLRGGLWLGWAKQA